MRIRPNKPLQPIAYSPLVPASFWRRVSLVVVLLARGFVEDERSDVLKVGE